MARYSPVREELRRAIAELRGDNLSPKRGAAAVGLGLLVGALPIFGFHLPVVLALCLWLRLDAVVAYLAANVSNPLLAPLLIAVEIEVGARFRRGPPFHLIRQFDPGAASSIGVDLLVGAPVVAVSLAGVGYLLAYCLLALRFRLWPSAPVRPPYRLPDDAPSWVTAVERVATRYAPDAKGAIRDRSYFHYVRLKLVADPVGRMIAAIDDNVLEGLGSVFDLGTGRGQLPILLLELGRASSAYGVDWDAAKIDAARLASSARGDLPSLPCAFAVADARVAAIPPSDTILVIDVLHYFCAEEQDRLLLRAARALNPGGRLVVREADTQQGFRTHLTLVEEWFFTCIGVNRGERVFFRPLRELRERLEDAGFACEVRPAWGSTPFSNLLLLARRPLER